MRVNGLSMLRQHPHGFDARLSNFGSHSIDIDVSFLYGLGSDDVCDDGDSYGGL